MSLRRAQTPAPEATPIKARERQRITARRARLNRGDVPHFYFLLSETDAWSRGGLAKTSGLPKEGFCDDGLCSGGSLAERTQTRPIWQNEPNLDFMRHHLHIEVLG